MDNADEARAIVREAKYPPIGSRGMSGMGPHTGYKNYGNRYQTEYAPWANENVILCPSIESLEGLKNVDAIAAVEGIDMIAYGHSDLSGALATEPGRYWTTEEAQRRAGLAQRAQAALRGRQ